MNVFADIETPLQSNHEEQSSMTLKMKKRKSRAFTKKTRTDVWKPTQSRKIEQYHWSKAEHELYLMFLRKNKKLFSLSLERRKVIKPHVLMGEYISTKSSKQCRSHHQKMMIKYETIDEILKSSSSMKSCFKRDDLERCAVDT